MTLLVGGAVALGLLLGATAVASAASTVTVNTTGDETQAGDGTCSLREATLYVNGTAAEPDCAATPPSGTTTINLPAGTYRLAGQPLTLTGRATLAGAGANATVISAAGMSQVFFIASGANVSLSDMTVTQGVSGRLCTGMCLALDTVNGLPGGGIANNGTLVLNRMIVSGNRTSPGDVNDNCDPAAVKVNGCAGGNGGPGGGISNAGTLTIANSTITANATGAGAAGKPGASGQGLGGTGGSGGSGGGIFNAGALTITNSTIAGNTTGTGADGGLGGDGANNTTGGNGGPGGSGGSGAGIENRGPLTISGSTISGNLTGAGGKGGGGGGGDPSNHTTGGSGALGGNGGAGGAVDSIADMTISNSTIVGNSAATPGAGGLAGSSAAVNAGPGNPGGGGGIEQEAMGTTLTHVSVAFNRAPGAGGGIDGDGGTVTAGNSIIASNLAAAPNPNCAGVVTDQGGNIEFGGSSCPPGFLRADPRLGPLANNGGPTQTVALLTGSAAIHHVRTCVLGVDQRGVGRPVGSACDSGAYQVAPPSLSGIGVSGVTTTGATIAASANPNLQDASVVINYGLTTGYGSSAPARDLGAGNAPVAFSSALTGLAPNTTYHFDVVATNADGRTTSNDGVFTTSPPLPPLAASIVGATTTGPALSLTIACTGGSGPSTCAGPIGLSAKDPTKHRRARVVSVAAGAYSVASGGSATVTLRLNRKGQTMLNQHYTLVSTLSLGGTTQQSQPVTFHYPVIESPISYTWAFSPGSSKATELTVTRIPRGGKLIVICRAGGCPFGTRRFVPRHGQVNLAPTFKQRALRPGARLELRVLAANQVGKVEIFAIRSSMPPVVKRECLPPGTSRPARCV